MKKCFDEINDFSINSQDKLLDLYECSYEHISDIDSQISELTKFRPNDPIISDKLQMAESHSHCDVAYSTSPEKCFQCFKSAQDISDPEQKVLEMVNCVNKHLGEKYKKCFNEKSLKITKIRD